MEFLPPAPAAARPIFGRAFAVTVVLLIVAATLGVAERTRSVADQRRQAQVELRRAQAATQQLRAIAAESEEAGNISSSSGVEALGAGTSMIDAIRRLDELDVRGAAAERLEQAADRLTASGKDTLALAQRGDLAGARRFFAATVDPLLQGIIADTERQIAIEDSRAREANRLARWVLIGGVLFGLLALALLVRRFEAVTRESRAGQMLRRQAFTDALTGLPNRAALEYELAQRLGAEEGGVQLVSSGASIATIALLDLDDLKTINDSLGHGRGDELVRTIGARIAASLAPDDLVTRFGGDEFGVLFHDPSPDRAAKEIERVLRAIHRPVLLGDRDVRVSASAGIAAGSDIESIVRDADVAMYSAKAAGKDRVAVFTQSMRDDALAQLELTADLRRALTRDELFLEYQPVVDMRGGQACGVEALVRWNHPVRGRMPPLEFISLAERTGLIGPLGWWVMETSCRQMCDWIAEGSATAHQHVSVNVSPIQLAEPGMARRIAKILRDTGLDPKQLQLEITESVLVDRPEALVSDLHELMDLGVRVAIDDFGTGHSVLAYLRDLPVDVLKIDKAFVDEIDRDPGRARLTQGIVQLARALDLGIVVEGIETAPQHDLLRGFGDMLGQGYLYSRPVAPAVAGRLLRDGDFGQAAAPAATSAA